VPLSDVSRKIMKDVKRKGKNENLDCEKLGWVYFDEFGHILTFFFNIFCSLHGEWLCFYFKNTTYLNKIIFF